MPLPCDEASNLPMTPSSRSRWRRPTARFFSPLVPALLCLLCHALAPGQASAKGAASDREAGERWRRELMAQAQQVPGDDVLMANGAVIGEIYVQTDDIFDPDKPDENRFVFQLANRLHVTTRPSVIEKRLLFSSGEPYDPRLLEETARYLRSLGFIYDAKVTPVRYRGNRVDVLVVTRDVWTLSLGAGFDRSGGANTVQFHIEESNLLGSGRFLDLKHSNDPDRESSRLRFVDQNVFDTRTEMRLWYASNSDGHRKVIDVAHPFFSLDTRWAAAFKLIADRRIERLYRQGEEAERFSHDRRFVEIHGGLSEGYQNGRTRRWLLGYTYQEDTFRNEGEVGNGGPFEPPGDGLPGGPIIIAPPSGGPPPVAPRRLSYIWIGLEEIEDGFVTLRNMDQINRTEDFNFGRELRLRLGFSSTALGALEDQAIFAADVRFGWDLNPRQTLFLSGYTHGRWGTDSHQNVHLGTRMRYYLRNFKRHRLTVTLHGDAQWNPDGENQLLLGGDTGLRGYPRRYQDGDRRLSIHLEQRFYTNWELFNLVHVGAGVFYDAGRAWYAGGEQDDRGILQDIGFGLRLGSSRSSRGRLVHLDVAYPLNGDERELQYLVTSQQSF